MQHGRPLEFMEGTKRSGAQRDSAVQTYVLTGLPGRSTNLSIYLLWDVLLAAGFLCCKAAVIGVQIKERPCTMLTVVGTRQLDSRM
jgi:hypothetical protein